MQLQLKYHDTPLRPAAAAFIRGGNAGDWLKEISSWNIPMSGLTCLIVAESTASINPAGLLVIFKEGNIPQADLISQPYGVLAGKLYLPVNASLAPDADTNELQSLLPWEWHIYHPSLGFTGFEKTDRLDLSTLLDYTPEFERTWDLASPGVKPPATLQMITLEKTQPEEVLKSLEESVKKKPLEDIDKDENASGVKKLLDDAKSAAVRGLIRGLNSLLNGDLSRKARSSGNDIQPGKFTRTASSSSGFGGMGGFRPRSSSPSWLDQLKAWLAKKVVDLEKERNKELNRLLRMFEEDMQKALEYAIPLGGMFADRGVADPTAHLSRRSTNLDFGLLGGGLRGDSWDVSDYFRNNLRTKYQEAANDAVRRKDFKKAAYIYAHLLGQYQEAANVLEQGRHYREAAAIYQKFLNNKLGAAQCLENGGLLQEAIPLYLELEKHEKAADLLLLTGKKEEAEKYYQKAADAAHSKQNFTEAARIHEEKLHEPDRAMLILLQGWQQEAHPEECMAQLYKIAAARDMDYLLGRVQYIYDEFTPAARQMQFLNTLSAARHQFRDERLNTLTTGIAYEIVSKQAALGNTHSLEKLREFVPGDNLLNSDTQRYVHSRSRMPKTAGQPKSFSLNDAAPGLEDAEWLTAAAWRDQILALAYEDGLLHLVRSNWKGEMDHWQWEFGRDHAFWAKFITSPADENKIVLASMSGLPIEEVRLPANSKFRDEVHLVSPRWLSQTDFSGVTLRTDGGFTLLINNDSGSVPATELVHYSAAGELESKTICWDEAEDRPAEISAYRHSEILCRNGNYYFADNCISEKGIVTDLAEDRYGVHVMAISSPHTALRLFACVFNDNEIGGLMLKRYVDSKQGTYFSTVPFATDLRISDMAMLPDNYLVISDGNTAEVYHAEDEMVSTRSAISTNTHIVAILPTDTRKQFALVESNGIVSVYGVEE